MFILEWIFVIVALEISVPAWLIVVLFPSCIVFLSVRKRIGPIWGIVSVIFLLQHVVMLILMSLSDNHIPKFIYPTPALLEYCILLCIIYVFRDLYRSLNLNSNK